MLTLEQSVEKYGNLINPLAPEKVKLTRALNRVLSEDVFSDVNMPPFDKSAMDGYACKQADLKNELTVIETIPAGSLSSKKIEKWQCAKIMTGAPVPEGADCVIMIEHTKEVGDNRIKYLKDNTKSNICYLGEDVKKKQKVLNSGTLIKPRHIPVLASVGCDKVTVFGLPRIGVLATGSELVEPGEKPQGAKIRNSNAYQLLALLEEMGLLANYYGIVSDNENEIEAAIKKAYEENNTILLTGGVSVGDFDLVPHIIKKLGMEIHFDKLAIKPGKPVVFASSGNKLCFALSGNPVSSFFQFELVCKPALYKQMGFEYLPELIEFELDGEIKRKKADRFGFFPVKRQGSNIVVPIEFHGSAHIHALKDAYGIIELPQGEFGIEKGTKVNVRPI